jgi:hypothetical protein
MNKIKTLFAATVLAIVAVATLQVHPTSAANASDFNPGYIIDDYVFYNSNAMNADQIQNFLNSKVPVCDTQGTGPSGYGNTRAQYAASKGWHGPPYTCLRDYKQNTPQMEAASGLCGALSAKSNSTSAQIIRDVAAACGINPQVLVILLEKEQSLVTDVWPLNIQLKNATGFACPDTAPCNPQYEGFFYQVYYAARQFKIYQAYPDSYNYRAGRSNNIYWHPDMARCGSSSVYIQNQATAALYIYTPYRPNQAALNNLYGTGDGCSSYGNRNFWRIFTDWFGSTKVSFTSFDDPRWMQIKNVTDKTHIPTNQLRGENIQPGLQLFFVDRIYANNRWYARTEFDRNNNNLNGIPIDDLQEVPISSITPKWASIDSLTNKYDPIRRKTHDSIEAKNHAVKIVDKITINSVEYYRTEFDKSINQTKFIPATTLVDFKFYDFFKPRSMVTRNNTPKYNVQTGEIVSQIPANTVLFLNKKITASGIFYAQATEDNSTSYAVKASDLKEMDSSAFIPFDNPRWMQIKIDTDKTHLDTNTLYGQDIKPGLQLFFVDKIFTNNQWYARTEFDKKYNNLDGIPFSDIEDISTIAIEPKWMSIESNTNKMDPFRRKSYDFINGKDHAIKVVDKVTINNTEYYRTEYDQSGNRMHFIPASDLVDFKFYDFFKPRLMTTNANVNKYNVQTGEIVGQIPANTTLFFNRKITTSGTFYAQLQSENGTTFAVKASDLREDQ